jgi:hypothetical protein
MRTVLVLSFAAFASTALAADAPAPVSTPVLNTATTITGQPIVVPPNPEALDASRQGETWTSSVWISWKWLCVAWSYPAPSGYSAALR